MDYNGPERRRGTDNQELFSMLARIDERTLGMVKVIESLATCERVDGLEKKLDEHVATHVSRGGMAAAWAGSIVALGLGVLGMVKK
jgi:hypothetical protein